MDWDTKVVIGTVIAGLIAVALLCWVAPVGAVIFIQPPLASGGASDTIGATTTGASSTTNWNPILCSAIDAPNITGVVSTIYVYSSNTSTTVDVTVGVYDDSSGPNAIVGTEKETLNPGTWAEGWKGFAVSTDVSLTAGINYWLCLEISEDIISLWYDSAAVTSRYYDTHTYGVSWPATFSIATSSTALYSIKAIVNN